MAVNWYNIRIHNGSQDQGFEELCCQLFHNEKLPGGVLFERRGYRDAGLECTYVCKDGALHGMQAKFFTRSPTSDEWGQVDKSVKTAIDKNPKLKSLTICVPQNFDDPKIIGKSSAMDQWKSHKSNWEKLAEEKNLQVEFKLWDDTQLTSRLTQISNRGRLWYFFHQAELTSEWFRDRVEEVAEDAKPRYTEELNIRLPIASLFEGLGRTVDFSLEPKKHFLTLSRNLGRLSSQICPAEAEAVNEEVMRLGRNLAEITRSIDFSGTNAIPLDKLHKISNNLLDAAHEARNILSRLESEKAAQARAERKVNGEPEPPYQSPIYDSLRGIHWEIASNAKFFYTFAESDAAKLANQPILLVSGSAGKGKTHLLVDVAKRRSKQKQPTIILLGENFQDSDPLVQVMELVGIKLDRDEFLQALEAAAEASGGRLLIIIDALNEGRGLDLWPKRLSGFIKMLERYPRLGLALSVRTTYEEAVIPEGVRQEAIRVIHDGFASQPEEAARAFFSHYGLNLPKIPLLNPEFTDPLFLKLLCQGLRSEGLHDMPEGYEGLSRMFNFLVEATNKKLQKSGKLKTGPHQNLVGAYLGRLADALTATGIDVLPLSVAEQISSELYLTDGYPDSLLAQLISEGLLATEMIAGQGSAFPQHGVGFAYQRFGDHETARRFLDQCTEAGSLEAALAPSGNIGRLFVEYYDFYRHQGLVEALSVQVPERAGKELIDLLQPLQNGSQGEIATGILAECLIKSLPWRHKNSITNNTFRVLERECTSESLYDSYLNVLLTLAAVPAHPLNAELLHSILESLPLPERDKMWTVWLHYHRDSENAADRLLAWCLLGDDKSHLPDDSVLLATIATAWLTVSTVRPMRDRATKAITRLLAYRSHLIAPLLDYFKDVDDPYITERLYAAAYGVAMQLAEPELLRNLAIDVYGRLFAQRPVNPHVMVLDYGRSIIECVAIRGGTLPFDITEARPPYGSILPPEPPSREYYQGLVNPDGNWSSRDRAYSHVVDRFSDFDVSRYSGGPSIKDGNFSAILLSEDVLPSSRISRQSWEDELTEGQREMWDEIERLRYRSAGSQFTITDIQDEDLDQDDDLPNTVSALENEGKSMPETNEYTRLVDSFFQTLTDVQVEKLAEFGVNRPAWGTEDLPALDRDMIVRWVVQRALELGWTQERFAAFDANVEHMRDSGYGTGQCDTIGAKYLWIAYYEVLARLTDNYRIFKGYQHDVAEPFEGSWELDLRTIDPSCLPVRRKSYDNEGSILDSAPYYSFDNVIEGHEDWLRRSDDLNDVALLLILKGSDGQEWVTLEKYPNYEQLSDNDEPGSLRKNLWLHLRGYLVKRETSAQVFEWMKNQDFMNRWMPEGGEVNDIFLGELYDLPAWKQHAFGGDWEYTDWRRPEKNCPADIASVKLSYIQSSDDTTSTEPMRIMTPSPIVVREANLRWSGIGGNWLDRNGSLAVQDPDVGSEARGSLLIRRDFLDHFLEDMGYDLIWTVLGEKLVYNLSSRNPNPRLEISGAVHYTADTLDEAIQKKYLAR